MSPFDDAAGVRGRSSLTVAIICAANICRSPALTSLIRDQLTDRDPVRLVQAGVTAQPGNAGCSQIASASALPADSLTGHRSQRLTTDVLDHADLILTASRAERSAVSRIRPVARRKTFTAREAIMLAEVEVPDGAPLVGGDHPPSAAEALHSRRALLPPPTGPDATGAHPFDIPDAHTSAWSHSDVGQLLINCGPQVARVIQDLAGAYTSGDSSATDASLSA